MAANSKFFLAVNYPWLAYGRDFGVSPWGYFGIALPESRAAVERDFAGMKSAGVSLLRWFLLCDGRSGIRYERGIPIGPDDSLFKDVRTALELATQANLQICFSLFDFLWLQVPEARGQAFPGRAALQFAGGREALLQKILIPLFREFEKHPAIFAWEIVNEPEWAIPEFLRSPKSTLSLGNARSYFSEIARAISSVAQLPSTLGAARLQWVRAWKEIGLDLLQAHYYPGLEREEKLSLPQQLESFGRLEQPLWMGELPAADPEFPGYSLAGALTDCQNAGLAGAGVWRWRAPEAGGKDAAFGSVEPQTLVAWNAGSVPQERFKRTDV